MRFFFFLFAISPLFGCYVGNPGSPAIMNTGLFSMKNPLLKGTTGYIWDYTSNKRYLAVNENKELDPKLNQFAIHTQTASASLIFLERLELFGTAGESKQTVSPVNPKKLFVDYEGSYQLSWGAGLKVILLQWGQTYFGTDFSYFTIPSSPKSFFKFLNRMNLPIDRQEQKFHLREWQITAGLASRFYFITPYVGAVYLRSKLHINSGPEIEAIDYRNKKNWGLFYGVTLSITGRFHLSFERRVGDEFSYTFGSTAVF